ncbi:Uncharacterised protein [Vibrio cholerae]|nr:Uncharacterised protein [Vibrio cholerae]
MAIQPMLIHRALHHVFQLTHIARPRVGLQLV